MTLTEFRALAERASPGPWEPWDSLYVGMKAAIVQPAANPLRTIAEVRTNFDDAKFIAAASPTAVLALIDRLERAEAVVESLHAQAVNVDNNGSPDPDQYTLGYEEAWAMVRKEIAAYFDAPAGEGER